MNADRSEAVAAWRRYDDDEQRLTAPISERMLDLAGLAPGQRVLDIASGRGEPALRAAARVAPDGLVVGTDIAADMLAFARARAAAASLGNLSLVVADGQTLAGVAEQAFDAALCRWGFMYFPRPLDALQAARGCLKPGGVLVSALWAEPERVSWWSMPRRVLAQHLTLPPLDADAPGPFRYAAPQQFRDELSRAGFALVAEEAHETAVMESETPQGLIDWSLAFGLAKLLAGQPDSVRLAWERDMRAEAQAHRDADGWYRLGGTTRLVLARA